MSLSAVVVAPALAAQDGSEGADRTGSGTARLDVIEVSGLLDPVIADFVGDAVDRAVDDGSVALVVQLDSTGSVLGATALDALVDRIEGAAVPVAVWIGPSGSTARGGAERLVAAADVSGISPGSSIDAEVGTSVVGDGPGTRPARLSADEALEEGVVGLDAPTLGDFVVSLDGLVLDGTALDTARVVATDDGPRREPVVTVRFAKLGLVARLLHTVASPAVAYLLVAAAMTLLLFEFFTGGIGVAGVAGAACLVLASTGLSTLPTRPGALVLLGLSALGFGIDIQTGVPRFWTAVGVVAFVAASLTLFDGHSISWLTLVAGVGGTLLMTTTATPAVVRSRYSTPTIGRDWIVGEVARVSQDVAPDGEVVIRGARWRARANRATPISSGSEARVVAIEGVVLEVEPMEGAARDYREGRGGHASDAGPPPASDGRSAGP